MIVLYNYLAPTGNQTGNNVLAVWSKPLEPQDYYLRMRRHGIGPTFCMWFVPGTVHA